MTVTLKDIAEKANLSTTTVSRILNGRESGLPIREDTRQKVLAIAAELGYRPNFMARALRGSRSSLIGVIAQNITSLFHSQILRGLNETMVQRGYRVFLGHVERQVDLAVDYGSMFEQSHADGILLIGELQGSETMLEKLLQKHRYVVGISDRGMRRGFPGVYADSHVGTRLALDHLWNRGHRRIACVADPTLHDARTRLEAYQQYMRDHDAPDQVHLTTRTFQGSYETGMQLFSQTDPVAYPTAIFAATDVIAVGLLQAAFQSAVRVPEQVSIIGYDNLDIAPYTIPPLTTISQFGGEMGRTAATMLIDMIEQEQDSAGVEDVVLTPSLIERQSTGVPID